MLQYLEEFKLLSLLQYRSLISRAHRSPMRDVSQRDFPAGQRLLALGARSSAERDLGVPLPEAQRPSLPSAAVTGEQGPTAVGVQSSGGVFSTSSSRSAVQQKHHFPFSRSYHETRQMSKTLTQPGTVAKPRQHKPVPGSTFLFSALALALCNTTSEFFHRGESPVSAEKHSRF